MDLWKRTLMGTVLVLGTAIVVAAGSQLPPGVVPPIATVVAVAAMPIVVVGGSSLVRLRTTASTERVVDAALHRHLVT